MMMMMVMMNRDDDNGDDDDNKNDKYDDDNSEDGDMSINRIYSIIIVLTHRLESPWVQKDLRLDGLIRASFQNNKNNHHNKV